MALLLGQASLSVRLIRHCKHWKHMLRGWKTDTITSHKNKKAGAFICLRKMATFVRSTPTALLQHPHEPCWGKNRRADAQSPSLQLPPTTTLQRTHGASCRRSGVYTNGGSYRTSNRACFLSCICSLMLPFVARPTLIIDDSPAYPRSEPPALRRLHEWQIPLLRHHVMFISLSCCCLLQG